MKIYIQELCVRLGLCIERAGGKAAVCKKSGISRAQLFRYLSGETVLPTDRLVLIAHASNVHPYWLLTGEGSPDIPPVQGFFSDDQQMVIDAKSLSACIEMADQIDRDYDFRMSAARKADFVFTLYQGVQTEGRLMGRPMMFESSKALEIYGLIAGIHGETARKMILNTVEIVSKASKNQLPEKEIRTYCNYLNSSIQNYYGHPTLSKPYYDRIGYELEPDTQSYVNELISEVKKQYLYRNEQIKILDLGCGNGRHLLHFAKDARLKATGLDNNELSKTICQNYEEAGKLSKGTFVQGDMFQIPLKDNSFDLVFANASLFHTPYLAESEHGLNHVIQEIRRILRPGGFLYIHSRYGNGFEPFPFFQLHNEGSIRQLCRRNAFQMIWFKEFFWKDSIEYIPKVNFNDWFSTLLCKQS